MSGAPRIEVRDLTKTYPLATGLVTAVDRISFGVD